MIVVAPADPRWPERFLAIAGPIRRALGDRALAIHHIGSTSVPDLPAKDVIDLQLSVFDLAMPLDDALAAAGFRLGAPRTDHCPPGMTLAPHELEKRFYKGGDSVANLHVRVTGSFNQRYALLFRDYLRATPLARDAYAEIKRQLARYFPHDLDAYYDVKDPVCDALLAGALDWARLHAWEPGPTDA